MPSEGAALGLVFHDLAASAAGSGFAMLPGTLIASAALPTALASNWPWFSTMITDAFARAPALVLGLGVLLAIPPLALIGVALRRRTRQHEDSSAETYLVTRLRSSSAPALPDARDQDLQSDRPGSGTRAFVELEGSEPLQRIPLANEVMRIGREPDNDIVLTDMTVHRYHAVIHRGDDADFMVTDLSSMDGNGVAVGGARVNRASLREGDVITLGNTRLKFVAGQK